MWGTNTSNPLRRNMENGQDGGGGLQTVISSGAFSKQFLGPEAGYTCISKLMKRPPLDTMISAKQPPSPIVKEIAGTNPGIST